MNLNTHPNVIEADPDVANEPTEWSVDEKDIVLKIKHILGIYPKLNWSQLQVSIGTAVPPSAWKPIALKMREEGMLNIDVQHIATPFGRTQGYTIISLTNPHG